MSKKHPLATCDKLKINKSIYHIKYLTLFYNNSHINISILIFYNNILKVNLHYKYIHK